MYWIIELLGTGRRAFVESYSNTYACPRITFCDGQAKPFSSEDEAKQWAKYYLSHKFMVGTKVIQYDASQHIIING